MVVARLHDTWDNWPEIGIRDSLAQGLGFSRFVGEDPTRWHATYEVPEQSLCDFARYIAQKVRPLGEDSVQVIGDPEMKVKRPSIGVGCGGPHEDMIALGSDDLAPVFTPVEIAPIQLQDIVEGALGNVDLGSWDLSELLSTAPIPRTFPVHPYALTNPIWIDRDGDGFDAPGLPAWVQPPFETASDGGEDTGGDEDDGDTGL